MSEVTTQHGRTFRAEWMKLKRSGTFWICFGAAIFIPLVYTTVFLFVDMPGAEGESNKWNELIENNIKGFTGFFFPVFLIIIVARMVYTEHRYDTWKLMETQPVPKLALYLAKWQIMLLISLLCLLGLVIFTLIGGSILQLVKTKSGLSESSIDWGLLSKVILRYWIASFGLITIQYFLGLWNKSFVLPLAIGLVATIAGSILAGFGYFNWWPYAAPSNTSSTFAGSLTGNFLMHHEKMSLLWAALFLWMGYQLYVKKHIVRAILTPIPRLGLTVLVLAVFVLAAWWVNKPAVLSAYKYTVIAGAIKSEKPVTNVVIFQSPAYDTVFNIPVVNGRFHVSSKEPVEPGMYFLKAGSHTMQLYFGSNDSVFIDMEMKKRMNDVKISGTRVAENEFMKKRVKNDFYYLENYAYQFKPDDYANQIKSEWETGKGYIRKFKTADNIKPSDQFLKVQEKLLSIKLLRLAEVVYPQVYAMYYPNEQFKFPAKLNELRKSADLEDKDLAGYSDLVTYLSELYRKKTGRNDSAYFAEVQQQVKQPRLRNVLYYDAINNSLPRIKDSAFRDTYLSKYISLITDVRLQHELVNTNARMKNLNRGKKAHIFSGEAMNGNEIVLAQLINRYVIIDVWATWCMPCKRESPFFEEFAEKYTTDKVAFVAVSVDENKNAWRMEAPSKSKRVLQLWAKNPDVDFTKQYAVSGIPRFMLIDPRGNIINANMPSPSDPEFENILLKEIPGLGNML